MKRKFSAHKKRYENNEISNAYLITAFIWLLLPTRVPTLITGFRQFINLTLSLHIRRNDKISPKLSHTLLCVPSSANLEVHDLDELWLVVNCGWESTLLLLSAKADKTVDGVV